MFKNVWTTLQKRSKSMIFAKEIAFSKRIISKISLKFLGENPFGPPNSTIWGFQGPAHLTRLVELGGPPLYGLVCFGALLTVPRFREYTQMSQTLPQQKI